MSKMQENISVKQKETWFHEKFTTWQVNQQT